MKHQWKLFEKQSHSIYGKGYHQSIENYQCERCTEKSIVTKYLSNTTNAPFTLPNGYDAYYERNWDEDCDRSILERVHNS